jgi:hypothetical protein
MLAVRVLEPMYANQKLVSDGTFEATIGENSRKASMRIRDLLGKKQTMTGDCPGRVVVRLGKLSWDPKTREGSQGHRDLIGFQVGAGQVPACRGQVARQSLAEMETVGVGRRQPTEGACWAQPRGGHGRNLYKVRQELIRAYICHIQDGIPVEGHFCFWSKFQVSDQ